MVPTLSIYLDLIRFVAALIVALSHVSQRLFPEYPLPFPGKDAVVVFFVLSGFVVAYVADTRETGWRDFAISRYSRLVSVFFPAMMLALLLAPAEGRVGEYGWDEMKNGLIASLINAFFLGQMWFLDITPPNNDPAWSLNYEACYYAIFGLAVFVPGKWRWPVVGLAAVLVGPKILILMPPWLAGCALYYNRGNLRLGPAVANWAFLGSIAAYLVYFVSNLNVVIRTNLSDIFPDAMAPLQWSNRFAGDYVLAVIVVVNFIAASDMDNWFTALLVRRQAIIRRAAAYTLSIYLYHMPLLVIFAAWLGGGQGLHGRDIMIAVLLIPTIVLLARATEFQRRAVKSALMRVAI